MRVLIAFPSTPGFAVESRASRAPRLWVSLILDFLADGASEAELLSEYPQRLTHQDVMAAIAYGAEMSRRKRILPVPLDRVA